MDDIYPKKSPQWRQILESIPNLEGRIMGNEVILPKGHKAIVKYRFEKRFTSLGNAQKRYFLWCECGKKICEITKKMQGCSLNEPFVEHLKMPYDEVEYVCFSREWLEDLPEDFRLKFCLFIRENSGILHLNFDTLTYLLIDDTMSDDAIAKLSEMLEGHEIFTKKMKVFRRK